MCAFVSNRNAGALEFAKCVALFVVFCFSVCKMLWITFLFAPFILHLWIYLLYVFIFAVLIWNWKVKHFGSWCFIVTAYLLKLGFIGFISLWRENCIYACFYGLENKWGFFFFVLLSFFVFVEFLSVNWNEIIFLFGGERGAIMSNEGEKRCPLCAEEMDWTDQQFKPCKCGYQVWKFSFIPFYLLWKLMLNISFSAK